MAATGGIVKGVIQKQLQPIKEDLEYIKQQVDRARYLIFHFHLPARQLGIFQISVLRIGKSENLIYYL